MNLITPMLPAIRVAVFGAVTWTIAKIQLPPEIAGPVTDWLMTGVAGAIAVGYATWAAKREARKP